MPFFGTGMIVEVFRQGGTMARDRDRLKIWGRTPVNWSAQSLSTLPGTPFLGFTAFSVRRTSCSVRVRLLGAGGCGGCNVASPPGPVSNRAWKEFSSSASCGLFPSAESLLALKLVMCWTPCHTRLESLLRKQSSILPLYSALASLMPRSKLALAML